MQKILVAFDFDHSIIDDNSDVYVHKLAPGGSLPAEINSLYNSKGWTDFMAAIFKYLHDNKTTPEEIAACMQEIPLIPGMKQLFEYLDQDMFEVIIISDSNSVFIGEVLRAAKLDHIVKATYTNPAHYDKDGCLKIEFYHTQDWCNISTVNLCKGHILEDHLSRRQACGVSYDRIMYVGDGSNDLCPCLKLQSPMDIAFVRTGFKLEKLVCDPKNQLKSAIVPWKSGVDILTAIKASLS